MRAAVRSCRRRPSAFRCLSTARAAASASGWRTKVPGEEGDADFRHGIVAIAPGAAVQGIHELRLARQDADRQPAAHDLPIGGEVGPDSRQRLHPAEMDPKAGDDLVHDESRARHFGDRAQPAQEFERLQVRVAALHGLDHDRGKILGVLLDPLQRCRGGIVEDHDILGRRRVECPPRPPESAACRRAG